MSDELSRSQKQFADLWLDGMPAGPAYIKAGYSKNGADASASALLKNPKVARYIAVEREAAALHTRITKWEVLDFLTKAIQTPIGEVTEKSQLAQEVTRDEIGGAITRTKIKMVGKMDAIDRMARMLGWNEPEKVKVDLGDQLADIIRRVRGS